MLEDDVEGALRVAGLNVCRTAALRVWDIEVEGCPVAFISQDDERSVGQDGQIRNPINNILLSVVEV